MIYVRSNYQEIETCVLFKMKLSGLINDSRKIKVVNSTFYQSLNSCKQMYPN